MRQPALKYVLRIHGQDYPRQGLVIARCLSGSMAMAAAKDAAGVSPPSHVVEITESGLSYATYTGRQR